MRPRLAMIVFVALFGLAAELQAQTFSNVTAASGITIPPVSSAQGNGRGMAFEDFDGDGDLDLLAPTGSGGVVNLWTQNGGVFTPVVCTAASFANGGARQCVAADIDNDGDQDVYITRGFGGPNQLLINNGQGIFTEEAAVRGAALAGDYYAASFGDYDRDGLLDLYVSPRTASGYPAYGAPRTLLRNVGNGFFANVTAAAGAGQPGVAFASMFFDYDRDGWPDLILGNDKGMVGAPPSDILRNQRNGTFQSVGALIGANAAIDCMGITFGDIENDGDWDIFQTNSPPGHLLLVSNGGAFMLGSTWWSIAGAYGLNTAETGWNANFLDYDNDGWIDLYVQHFPGFHRLFRNVFGVAFVDVSFTTAVASLPTTQSGTAVDFDGDGDVDIFNAGLITQAQLLANPGFGGNWLRVKLVGTSSNRDALGAVVMARTGATTRMRASTSGEGFLCDAGKALHFGLGTAGIVDELEIRWPSGTVSFAKNVGVNQTITIVEPRFSSTPLAAGATNSLTLALPDDVGLPYVVGVTIDFAQELYLPDQRAIRCNINDPILVMTTTAGNAVLAGSVGLMSATGATLGLTLPGVPALSGFPFALIGATIEFTRPGGVCSIVGPCLYAYP